MIKYLLMLLILVGIVASSFIMAGCISKPDIEGQTNNCKAYYYCLYSKAYSKDKSIVCDDSRCCKSNNYITCKEDHKVDTKDFADCLLYFSK